MRKEGARLLSPLLKPLFHKMHEIQPMLRHLPSTARGLLDQIGGVAALPSLLFESTAEDLLSQLANNNLTHAVIIAHPPMASNEHILEMAQTHPELIAAVNIPPETPHPGAQLKDYQKEGAKILKIHAASDGLAPTSEHYKELLVTAAELEMPVIVHTGEIQNKLFYKDPSQGRAEKFARWFKLYPHTQFILAHMNFHDPNTAIDLAQTYPNIQLETSWQPPEMIAEAIRRVGPERVLFGSDWPLLGDNISIGLERVQSCHQKGLISQAEVDLILGGNAAKLVGLDAV